MVISACEGAKDGKWVYVPHMLTHEGCTTHMHATSSTNLVIKLNRLPWVTAGGIGDMLDGLWCHVGCHGVASGGMLGDIC